MWLYFFLIQVGLTATGSLYGVMGMTQRNQPTREHNAPSWADIL